MSLIRNKYFWCSGLAALLGSTVLYGCLAGKTRPAPPANVTPLSAEKGVTVFAAGDIADCRKLDPAESGAAKTAALIASNIVAGEDYAVLALGDTSYPVATPAEYINCYDQTWGRFKAHTYPAPGNHEYYSPTAYGYFTYFGKAAGPERRGYYSFDLGGWHLISINSNLKPAEHAEQLAWLAKDLERNRSACTLAFWHHPRYSSGGNGNVEKMQDIWRELAGARADLVLAGHDHDYERFSPMDADGNRDDSNGIRSFVVGTGGAWLTPMIFMKRNSEASDNRTLGVLRLKLKSDSYDWEFLPVAGSPFTDRGTARCNRK